MLKVPFELYNLLISVYILTLSNIVCILYFSYFVILLLICMYKFIVIQIALASSYTLIICNNCVIFTTLLRLTSYDVLRCVYMLLVHCDGHRVTYQVLRRMTSYDVLTVCVLLHC